MVTAMLRYDWQKQHAQDEVLPPVHMRQLYEAVGGAACATCRWVEFPQVRSGRIQVYQSPCRIAIALARCPTVPCHQCIAVRWPCLFLGGSGATGSALPTFYVLARAQAHHMDTYEVAAQEYWPALTSFVQSCGILDGTLSSALDPVVGPCYAIPGCDCKCRSHSARALAWLCQLCPEAED